MTEEFDEDGLGPFRGLIAAVVPCAVFWIAVLAVVFSLSGCGGGDMTADPQPVEATSNAQGGSDSFPMAVVAARLIGPEIALQAPARLVVELRTTWAQRVAVLTRTCALL